MVGPAEQAKIVDVQRRLVADFPEVGFAHVRIVVTEVYAYYATSRVRDYLPLLVEKQARTLLERGLPAPA